MSPRRILALALISALSTISAAASDKPRPAPPVKPAPQYPAHETHETEKVTVAIDPCDDKDLCPFFRLSYTSHGFVAVRVIITNDRDEPLNLEEVRIQFLPAEGDKEAAATDEDLNRRLFTRKSTVPTHIPLTPITINKEPIDKQILNDDADFGFKSLIVSPHSTSAGYIFYDTQHVEEPALKHAEIYVKQITYIDARGKKQELFAFTIPFDKWLDSLPPDPPKKPSEK